jgi:predicted helicase
MGLWDKNKKRRQYHKENGIVNDWIREHNKPKYILDLLMSVIAVSVKTVEIVKGLPKIEFE